MAEVWICTSCGAATNADDTRLLLRLGWELTSLHRDRERRFALCPSCKDEHEHAASARSGPGRAA